MEFVSCELTGPAAAGGFSGLRHFLHVGLAYAARRVVAKPFVDAPAEYDPPFVTTAVLTNLTRYSSICDAGWSVYIQTSLIGRGVE